jgi:hypothetical protein
MKKLFLLTGAFVYASLLFGQKFEEPKLTAKFDTLKVKIGADFGLQYQSLHEASDSAKLVPLGTGVNLPTANFNIDAYLGQGMKVNLVTYLAARHHNDTWVKGGYLLIDHLPINWALADKVMENITLKVGVMELNYGDAHFRRSDNGNIINNRFVGNYVLDAFCTAPAIEVMYRKNGLLAMLATTTGIVNQQIVTYNATTKTYTPYNQYDELGYYGKIGYDKQLNEDLRVRLTLSAYHCAKSHSGSLYNGDRTGSRYYLVMNRQTNAATDVDITVNPTTGDWPPFTTSLNNTQMLNLFAQYKGLEFFGTFENVLGTSPGTDPDYKVTQTAVEGLYHFGADRRFYGGARYDVVTNKGQITTKYGKSMDRVQLVLGWNLNKYVITKVEYVNENYNNFIGYGNNSYFRGIMVDAGISF